MGLFSKRPPEGGEEKVKLPHGGGLRKLTSYCSTCRGGVCRCKAIAAADRAKAAKYNRPVTCGQRFASGGTCYKTAPCNRDHSKH